MLLKLRRTHNPPGQRTPEYLAWQNMRRRCGDPNHPNWKHYGGRGISVCQSWQQHFLHFFEHVGERPSPEHSLDRIDNDGNYEPGNVRWATAEQQANNRRNNRPKTVEPTFELEPPDNWDELVKKYAVNPYELPK